MRMLGAGWFLLCLMFTGVADAASRVEGMRVWRAPDNTRLVFDLSGPVKSELFTLTEPNRIVIDLSGAELQRQLDQAELKGTPVADIRFAQRSADQLRLVLDVRQAVTPKSFSLTPNGQYGHRLVVDLYDSPAAAEPDVPATATPEKPATPVVPSAPQSRLPAIAGAKRDVIIAIDPGHGGEDPGASGSGLHEKDIVLSIARRLQSEINSQRGYRAELTRTGDYFIPLRQRTVIARKKGADLFVSIHADAAPNGSAYGASVFALSQRGATSETARWLADTENRSDLIGGVSTSDKDQMLAGVLLDLSMTATLASSLDVGRRVLTGVGGLTQLHKGQVEQAGFVVLKNPDIPSILVETGFISTPSEARKLASPSYQQSLATAIAQGIRGYFQRNAPPGTYLAALREANKGAGSAPESHRVARGESLSMIANRYDVSLSALRSANSLKDDRLVVGQTLKIPATNLAAQQ